MPQENPLHLSLEELKCFDQLLFIAHKLDKSTVTEKVQEYHALGVECRELADRKKDSLVKVTLLDLSETLPQINEENFVQSSNQLKDVVGVGDPSFSHKVSQFCSFVTNLEKAKKIAAQPTPLTVRKLLDTSARGSRDSGHSSF